MSTHPVSDSGTVSISLNQLCEKVCHGQGRASPVASMIPTTSLILPSGTSTNSQCTLVSSSKSFQIFKSASFSWTACLGIATVRMIFSSESGYCVSAFAVLIMTVAAMTRTKTRDKNFFHGITSLFFRSFHDRLTYP